jgi:hypothetical protein
MKRLMLCLAVCCLGLSITGCAKAGNASGDYFPLSVGTTWEYRITIGPSEPLMFTTTWSPLGDQYVVRDNRSRFRTYIMGPKRASYNLSFRINGVGHLPSALYKLSGVEIKIIKDELGIFGDNPENVSWAVDRENGLHVIEVIETMGMASSYPTQDHSRKLIYFDGDVGQGVTVSSESDYLYYLGIEQGKRHYQRKIESSTPGFEVPSHVKGMDRLTGAINQDLWYEPGKGMTKLVQTQNGQMAMTWELVRFTPGR